MYKYLARTSSIAFMAIVMVLFCGCNKQDKDSPTIELLTTENADGTPSVHFEAGEAVVVHVVMADNELLNQVKITLTGMEGFGESSGLISESGFFGDWEGSNISKLEGTLSDKKIHLTLSDTIQGWWQVQATVLDDSGRLSEVGSVQIEVSNQHAPKMDFANVYPALVDNSWNVKAGQSLKISGSISDDSGLATTQIRWLNANGVVMQSTTVEHNELTFFSLSSQDYVVPSNASGQLYLEFNSVDIEGLGSVTRMTMKVEE